jgi:hypothetical protein
VVTVRWVEGNTVHYVLDTDQPHQVKDTSIDRFLEIINMPLEQAQRQAKWGWL